MRFIARILFVFILFLIFVPKTFAQDNFTTDYNVTYNIQSSAQTYVNINVALTNLTPNYYASSYSIQVGFDDIRNLTAVDDGGKITPKIEKINRGSKIEIPFNEKSIGLGKKLSFSISFNTNEVAQDLKSVWDVNIPGISSDNNFENFNATVTYPSFLGKPTFIKPQIPNVLALATTNSIKFNKDQLGNSGISIAFGNFQAYDFNLTYHLENENVFATQTEIALPPSTNYQDITINQIYPKPLNVYADSDGNWLAKYILAPSKKINIKVVGQAKIYLIPKTETITATQVRDYLNKQDFWQTDNPKIQTLAKSLNSPRAIYDYVVKTLKYDFSRVESNSPRLGAVNILNSPSSAVCLEFTDLFVTLARAAGIPARAINGFAYTDNTTQRPLSLLKDVLHAWPEYYDSEKNTWVMVDPTWGNTTNGVDYFDTLDFDHFTFVINGENSSYPVPAGGYKFANNLNTKDVDVNIAPKLNGGSSSINPEIDINSTIIAGLPIKGEVKIENTGSTQFDPSTLDIFADNLTPGSQVINTDTIPPYGHITVPFNFDKTQFLTKQADTVRIAIDQKSAYKNVFIVPFFLHLWFLLGGLGFVSIIIAISLIIYGYRRISVLRQKRENNLLRESDKS